MANIDYTGAMALAHGYRDLFDRAPFRRRELAAGRPVQPDPTAEALVMVEEGRLLATVLDLSGDEVLCTLREEGMLLGLEVLADLPVSYVLWPLVDSVVWSTSRSSFEACLDDEASANFVAHLAAQAVGVCLQERLTLARPTVARVAYFLDRTAGAGPHAPAITLPRHVLARLLAMRPETLSRALRRLELDGAIEVGLRSVRVIDTDRLQRASSG